VVGLVANIHKQKAVHLFLESANLILKHIPDVYFVIIGDGVLKNEMEEIARSLKIDHRTVFTGHREDASLLMKGINIFALSSLWEGFPITILEAMRAEIPCVVTDVGGNKEAVKDGVTGFVVMPQRPELMAEQILLLIKSHKKAREMGIAGRAAFLEKFTAEIMVRKTERIYDEILNLN
jgi:glycosyltransferase involved in cell wall biosynthesis